MDELEGLKTYNVLLAVISRDLQKAKDIQDIKKVIGDLNFVADQLRSLLIEMGIEL